MQLTPHFTLEELSRSETAARHGVNNTIPASLLSNAKKVANNLEIIRAHENAPITVFSCYRGPKVNALVGGSETSAHMQALAADCKVIGKSVKATCELAARVIPDFDQIIYEFGESGWCHIGFAAPGKKPRKQLLTAVKVNGKTVYKPGILSV